MRKSHHLSHLCFAVCCTIIFGVIAVSHDFSITRLLIGAVSGALLSLAYWALDSWLLRCISLKGLSTVFLGLLLGYFLAGVVGKTAKQIFPTLEQAEYFQPALYLLSAFTCILTLLRTSGKTYIQLPFIKLSALGSQDKSLIIDLSALKDPRLIPLIESGIIAHHLSVPTFIQKEIASLPKEEARCASENLFRLEESCQKARVPCSFPELPFSMERDYREKLQRVTKLFHSDILFSELPEDPIYLSPERRVLTLQHISHILKPQVSGEGWIQLKVQRPGKEQGQGVGYLEDGSMVVINGAGDHVGQEIKARIISSKFTSSGRIIFSNLVEEPCSKSKQLVGV